MKFLQVLLMSSVLLASASWAADQAPALRGAELHVSKGVQCQVCHGTNGDIPTVEQCSTCHPKDALIEKTKDVKPFNPHAAPHNAECTGCHLQHEAAVDYCEKCHIYGYKVK